MVNTLKTKDLGQQLGRIESWAVLGPDADSPWSSRRGGLCESTGSCTEGAEGAAGLSGRISQKEKDPRGHFGELSYSSSSSHLSPELPCVPACLWGILSPNPKHQGESAHLGGA